MRIIYNSSEFRSMNSVKKIYTTRQLYPKIETAVSACLIVTSNMSAITSKELNQIINKALPQDVLAGPNLNLNETYNYIRTSLIKDLPSSDIKNLNNDLKWRFLLHKHSFQRKSRVKKKKTFLTRKQRLDLNLLKLPKEGWNYTTLEPLRSMWKDYMRQNLDLIPKAPTCNEPDWSSFSTIVAKSELVGAELTVVQSKVPSQVGMSGTVVLESKMTFQIVTPQSKLKTLVKDCSVFQFQLDNMRFTVFGKLIATRPSERSVKKIKSQMIPEL